jgi:N-acyl-D-aspartate/D-glutamate deacylase
MYSLIIKQGLVADGTGKPERVADIAIEGDKIVAVDGQITTGAHTVINAKGKVVAPGFIDAQNHSDSYWQLFDNPSLDSLVTQGYTTALVGHCGASLAPLLSQEALLALQKWHNLEGTNINWQTFGEFAGVMATRRFGCNIASLVGYSTLRRGLVGDRVDPLTAPETEALKRILQDALEQGAFGMSTGLAYAHEVANSEVELYELAQVLKKNDALLSIHLRNEARDITESVREAINLAQQAEVNVKISHLKIRNRANWDKMDEVITELETAWHKGAKIHFDVYPYTSIWQVLYSYLPKWAIAGGRRHILEQLREPVQRNKILSALNNSQTSLKDLIIASAASNLQVNGKSLGRLAADMEISSEEALLKLVENGGSEVLVFDECLDAGQVAQFTNHALGFIATDGGGFALDTKGRLVHPRCFGAAPRFLRQAIDGKTLPLGEAVRKLTGGPAEAAGIQGRGIIKAGNYADIVIFDPAAIADRATLINPYQFSVGIEQVLVNGKAAVHQGQFIGAENGKFLIRT